MSDRFDTARDDAVLHVVYVSTLSSDFDYSCYASICRTSRARNEQSGVSGMLLFDGQQFVQWLFGAHATVTALMSAIARDPRHSDIHVVYESPTSPLTLPVKWRAGLVGPEAIEAFVATVLQAQTAVSHGLDRLVDEADFDPDP
jgi:hypothetical protein